MFFGFVLCTNLTVFWGCVRPLTLKEASRILATKDDYREHVDMCEQEGNAPLPMSDFKSDSPTALSRRGMMDDPTHGVYTSDVLNASPGEVVASDGNVVQYKCTTLPQMSGCPCKLSLLSFVICVSPDGCHVTTAWHMLPESKCCIMHVVGVSLCGITSVFLGLHGQVVYVSFDLLN